MKLILLFLSISFFYFSCNKKDNSNNNSSELIIKKEDKNLNISTKKAAPVIKKEKIVIGSLLSPEGFQISTPDACETIDYLFYSDSLIVELYDYEYGWRVGKWFLRNDTIFISYFKEVRKKGIGEPEIVYLESTTGTYKEELYRIYSIYATHIIKLYEQNYQPLIYPYTWTDLKKEIITGNGYSLIENNSNISKFDINLPGNYAIASYRKLDIIDIENFTRNELRLMRNEIFARYGYIFNSKDLTDYFKQFDWYKPNKKNVDIYLSDIEKQNINIIIESENTAID